MHNHLSQPRKMQFPFILIRLNPNEKNREHRHQSDLFDKI